METSALVKALEVYLQVSYDLLEAYTTYYWNKVDNWKHIPQNSDNYCIFTEVWPCWLLHQNQLIALVIAYHYRNLGTVLLKKSNWSNSCFQKVFYNSTLLCTICFQRTVSNPDETQKWGGGGGQSDSANSPKYSYYIIFLHICFSPTGSQACCSF